MTKEEHRKLLEEIENLNAQVLDLLEKGKNLNSQVRKLIKESKKPMKK
tara:strand:+ start:208 stop:351 length:144 start_codon:yes stop_codon:yes gene_type:complete